MELAGSASLDTDEHSDLLPGEFTSMGFFMAHKGMLCILTKA